MANNKVLGDLLHVLIVEEGVEAQLVCGRGGEENKRGGRGRRGCNVIKYALAPGEGREGGAICAQVIDARTSRPSPPHPTPPTNQMSRSQKLLLGLWRSRVIEQISTALSYSGATFLASCQRSEENSERSARQR